MKLRIARSARERSWNRSANTANRPRATSIRKLRAKKKMSVPLKPQQNTTPLSTNMSKVVSTTRKTTEKTLCSPMQKTLRKKLHRGTKANRCSQIRQRGITTMMKMMTEPVPRTKITTIMAAALVEVTVIPAPKEGPWNFWGS